MTQPNGGENWTIGDSHAITWTGGGSGPATVEVSRDGGTTWTETIADGTPNDGSCGWTVSGPATLSARVRVTTSEGRDISDTSFSVNQQAPSPWEWVAQISGLTTWLEDAWSAEPGPA